MATPNQVRRRGRFSLVLGTLVAALLVVAVAYADTVTADGDTLTAGTQATVNLGTVSPGAVLTPTTRFTLTCTGKDHPDLEQTLNLEFSLASSTVPAGGSLSATDGSVGPIPATWPDDASGGGSTNCASTPQTLSSGGVGTGSDSTVTITAPNVPGTYSYTVRWDFNLSPEGNGDSQALVSNHTTVTYTLTVAAPSDTTAPTTTITLDPATANGNNGWYTSSVKVTVGSSASDLAETRCVLDPASAPANFDAIPSGCAYLAPGALVSSDGQHVVYAASKDTTGNKESVQSASFKIDATKPTITASATKADSSAYTSGTWTNQTVTVSFVCSDATSGLASACPLNVEVSSNTTAAGQNVSASISDNAGNSQTSNTINVKVDKDSPTVSVVGFTNGQLIDLGTALPSVSCSRSDGLSGIDALGNSGPTMTADTRNVNGVGSVTYSCGARDNAGNSATDSKTFTVIYGGAVQFLQPINGTAHTLSSNPDVSTFKAGSTVPVKVQVKLADGSIVQPISALWITPQKGGATSQAVDEAVYSEPAMSGSSYVWNSVDQFSQYNWGSPKNGGGFYWLIGIKLDDGQVYKVYISLR